MLSYWSEDRSLFDVKTALASCEFTPNYGYPVHFFPPFPSRKTASLLEISILPKQLPGRFALVQSISNMAIERFVGFTCNAESNFTFILDVLVHI